MRKQMMKKFNQLMLKHGNIMAFVFFWVGILISQIIIRIAMRV